EGSVEAPFYEQLLERYGEFLSYKLFGKIFNSVDDGLRICGLQREDVDFVSFDHLHVQDCRMLMGTTEPVMDDREPKPPFFPNAEMESWKRQWRVVPTFVYGGMNYGRIEPPVRA